MVEWKPFMVRWSQEMMQTELSERVDPPPESSDWLGFPPATETEISELEERLGVMLPPSYHSFLLCSNGWRRTTPFIGRLRPTSEVNWFRVENEDWADIFSENGSQESDEAYFDYKQNDGSDHRAEHMQSLLQISDAEDGVYLLNPEAVTPDGEWEAWFFANWIPGARRYPSFAHLLVAEFKSFRMLEKIEGSSDVLPKLKILSPRIPRVPAERIRKKLPRADSFETLIERMQSSDEKNRGRAIRTFCGKIGLRYNSPGRPELIDPLTDLFHKSIDPQVRSACIAGLTQFAEADVPPGELLEALSDPDPGVVLQGIFALSYFPNPRAVEPLCRFIESRANILFNENAMGALREMGDPRAVPTLKNVLFDTATNFDQSFGSAGLALGHCGPEGFQVLVSALNHDDARIRRAAVVGLDSSGNPEATPYLDRMENDPDDSVRQRARQRVGNIFE